MNILKTNLSTVTKDILALLLIFFLFTSCQKDDHHVVAPPAKLAIIHAAPGSTAYNLKMNSIRLNAVPLTYSNFISYSLVSSGKSDFSITPKGSNIAETRASLALKPYTDYSLYITGVPGNTDLLLTEDDLSPPVPNKAKLRFINLSPDAGPVTLQLLADTTRLFSNVAYKSSTAFIQVAPATGTGFILTDSVNNATLVISSKYKIQPGRIYTIIAKGLRAAKDTTTRLALGMINNQ
jgi:hypothetical protein